ncbi:MAG: hypothetical protein QOD72_3302 [Acidimicrobiaceae bacterium]|nr:hypothetical protein [Acidimicrobiaceae bacterium]
MAEPDSRPAFYAAARGGWRDWWTLLHPPYTAWHLAYVVIGASLAPRTDGVRLTATVLAFFCAVGIAAHALDEVHGHPLRTAIADPVLWLAAAVGLAGAVVLGVLGLSRVGPGLLVFIVVGPVLVAGYNLELFGGRLHTDVTFALAWGTFPVLAGYFAQAERLDFVALLGGSAAFALSYAQRALSTPARQLRRRVTRVEGTLVMDDGSVRDLTDRVLLEPLERALRALSWSTVVLSVAMAAARLR